MIKGHKKHCSLFFIRTLSLGCEKSMNVSSSRSPLKSIFHGKSAWRGSLRQELIPLSWLQPVKWTFSLRVILCIKLDPALQYGDFSPFLKFRKLTCALSRHNELRFREFAKWHWRNWSLIDYGGIVARFCFRWPNSCSRISRIKGSILHENTFLQLDQLRGYYESLPRMLSGISRLASDSLYARPVRKRQRKTEYVVFSKCRSYLVARNGSDSRLKRNFRWRMT